MTERVYVEIPSAVANLGSYFMSGLQWHHEEGRQFHSVQGFLNFFHL